jgi:glycosyltransferase involved in cell wall biosynthesis
MRIVFLSYNYSHDIKSPTEWVKRINFYVGWNEYLAKEHDVIRIDQINFTGDFRHNGIGYYFIDDGKKRNLFPGKLNHFVKNLHPDVVIVSSFQFPLQVIQLRRCLGNKVTIILQHHAEKPFTGIKKLFQRYASSCADVFLFTSRSTGMEWKRKNNLDSVNKIHELMEVSSPFYLLDKNDAKKYTNMTGSPVFIWVGRLNSNKDPITVIKAFLQFSVTQPDARLYMIFQTTELISEIKNLLSDNQGRNPIVLVGNVPHEELLYWYNSADFYISASHYEGSGTALCEAMSCGCSPIVSDIPPFRTIAGASGQFFEAGNEKSLLLILNQSLRLNLDLLQNNALQIFKTELSFEAISNKFQMILRSL